MTTIVIYGFYIEGLSRTDPLSKCHVALVVDLHFFMSKNILHRLCFLFSIWKALLIFKLQGTKSFHLCNNTMKMMKIVVLLTDISGRRK